MDALGGGGIVSKSEAVTALRNSLLPLASEILDQDFANFLGDMQGKKLTALEIRDFLSGEFDPISIADVMRYLRAREQAGVIRLVKR